MAGGDPFDFLEEINLLSEAMQDELFAHAVLLERFGPSLGRPLVDTLKRSRHPNMKELRFNWEGKVWRVAFAFDPDRKAILLAGGGKEGTNQARFYRKLIALADKRFQQHLNALRATKKKPRER